jgi:hypothetical protein
MEVRLCERGLLHRAFEVLLVRLAITLMKSVVFSFLLVLKGDLSSPTDSQMTMQAGMPVHVTSIDLLKEQQHPASQRFCSLH